MSETARFQETLRRLAMVDETFVGDQVGRAAVAGISGLLSFLPG